MVRWSVILNILLLIFYSRNLYPSDGGLCGIVLNEVGTLIVSYPLCGVG
jgi:hypothetical protein